MARVVHPIEKQSYRDPARAGRHLGAAAVDPGRRRAGHPRQRRLGYLDDLVSAEADLSAGAQALRDGAPVVADSAMIAAGITPATRCAA